MKNKHMTKPDSFSKHLTSTVAKESGYVHRKARESVHECIRDVHEVGDALEVGGRTDDHPDGLNAHFFTIFHDHPDYHVSMPPGGLTAL